MQRRALWLRNNEFSWALTALLAAAVLITAAARRSFEYDEAYTFFLTAGVPRPAWPTVPFLAGEMRGLFQVRASLSAIAAALRATDVHPPLYFWAIDIWRQALGGGLLVARLFSVMCVLAALVAVGQLGRQARIPPVTAVLLTLGCYGFTYTGAVARGFAFAQALSRWGAVAACWARRRASPKYAALSGLLLGAATATNYLTLFVAAAVLLWLPLTSSCEEGKGPATSIFCFTPAIAGFGIFLPLDLWFFAAQHASRTGQFPPFAWVPGMMRLAQCYAGALLGAIPRYLPPPTCLVLQAVLASLLVGLVIAVVLRWRSVSVPEMRRLFALAAIAPAAGLLILGLVFNNTPIEVRYLAFATPFCALLLAGAAPRPLLIVLGAVQAVSIAGLLFHPLTMQTARATATAAATFASPDALVLLPYGNDGVGVVGPFLGEAPVALRVLVVRPAATPQDLLAATASAHRLILALPAPDAVSRAIVPVMRAVFIPPCWQPVRSPARVLVLDRAC
jgi:hypothetical protein